MCVLCITITKHGLVCFCVCLFCGCLLVLCITRIKHGLIVFFVLCFALGVVDRLFCLWFALFFVLVISVVLLWVCVCLFVYVVFVCFL